mgnify:CR=1 FL=1|jgi:hypothetical protein
MPTYDYQYRREQRVNFQIETDNGQAYLTMEDETHD